jgi:hypothetical protein
LSTLHGDLAPGNLPALASMWPVSFQIYTTEHDRETIQQSSVFGKLSQIVRTEFAILGPARPEEKYSVMTRLQHEVLRSALDRRAAIVSIMPDTIWADGSLRTVGRAARAGKRAVMQAGIRVLKSEVLAAITACRSVDGVLALPPRELVRVGLDHMHPYNRAWYWDAPRFSRNPANVYWRINHDGLIARCFHLHPLMLFPQRPVTHFVSTFDDDLPLLACPNYDSIDVVEDSDQAFHLDLAEDEWCTEVLTLNRQPSSAYLTKWARRSANLHHRRFVRHRIRIHAAALSEKWRDVERGSDRVVRVVVLWMGLQSAASRPLEWLFGINRDRLVEQAAVAPVSWALFPPVRIGISDLIRLARTLRLAMVARGLEALHHLAFRTALTAVFGNDVACRTLGIDPKLPKRRAKHRWRELRRRLRRTQRAKRWAKELTRRVRRAVTRAASPIARATRLNRRRAAEQVIVTCRRLLRRSRYAAKRRHRLATRLRKSARIGFERVRRLGLR